jgi:hypothetical protein
MRSNAAAVEEALQGMDYPKKKQEILDYARKHNAPETVISDLQDISDRRYITAKDLKQEFPSGSSQYPKASKEEIPANLKENAMNRGNDFFCMEREER